jgi:hypothetical protein
MLNIVKKGKFRVLKIAQEQKKQEHIMLNIVTSRIIIISRIIISKVLGIRFLCDSEITNIHCDLYCDPLLGY